MFDWFNIDSHVQRTIMFVYFYLFDQEDDHEDLSTVAHYTLIKK